MKLKIIFLIFILFLIVGAGCQDENQDETEKEKPAEEINTENIESEFYDGLDDSLKELNEIEKEAS